MLASFGALFLSRVVLLSSVECLNGEQITNGECVATIPHTFCTGVLTHSHAVYVCPHWCVQTRTLPHTHPFSLQFESLKKRHYRMSIIPVTSGAVAQNCFQALNYLIWDFPCGPVVKTACFHSIARAMGSIPGPETKILHAAPRGQKLNKNKLRELSGRRKLLLHM